MKKKKTFNKFYKWSFDHLETLEAHSAKIEMLTNRARAIELELQQFRALQIDCGGTLRAESRFITSEPINKDVIRLIYEKIQLGTKIEALIKENQQLKDKLAAPAADVKGYEDAYIDGYRYAMEIYEAGVYPTINESKSREYYHDRAVQRAVFPDVINR